MSSSPQITPIPLADIRPLRDLYVHEMDCQVIHDSIHDRPGWSQEYAVRVGDQVVGYGSIAVAGPWKDKPTLYEFYLLPHYRSRTFELFEALLDATRPVAIETQSNDPLLTTMLHLYARDVQTESILFHDRITTHHVQPGVTFRRSTPDDAEPIAAGKLDEDAAFVLEVEEPSGKAIVATGGMLFHYNRPYGDIYMCVAEPYRRRGLGAFIVQEVKRIAYEKGRIPAARCSHTNVASRRTLQKAGLVPCGHLLTGHRMR